MPDDILSFPSYWESSYFPSHEKPASANNEALSPCFFSLDLRWMPPNVSLPKNFSELHQRLLNDMRALETGAVVNQDEGRMVGHHWLRASELAPKKEALEIENALTQMAALLEDIGSRFSKVLVIGIGGSALGTQCLSHALLHQATKRRLYFLDNTDPDGIAALLLDLGPLKDVLTLVISKSGGTRESKNGLLALKAAYHREGLPHEPQMVAISVEGSQLYEEGKDWLGRLPLWNWVGGRFSVTSVVGLFPLALEGHPVHQLLEGAAWMDRRTRSEHIEDNPAMLMAYAWYALKKTEGKQNMVLLPYKDSLSLFSRYMQQLIMESIGKKSDRNGAIVHEGLTVYGNKGSSDQHAYIQQLREGPKDFFVTFIEVLKDNRQEAQDIDPSIGEDTWVSDYLSGFLSGTREALFQSGSPSLSLCLSEANALSLGALVALFERSVSFYASLVNVNAYNQPGVEAGKKAADGIIAIQKHILKLQKKGFQGTAKDFGIELQEREELVFHVLMHLYARGRMGGKGQGLQRIFF